VRDKNDGHAELPLQLADDGQNLRLYGHVQGGRRLVGYQELRAAGQGHRDHHALAHAARQLVRKPLYHGLGIGQPHHVQKTGRFRQSGTHVHALVKNQGFRYLVSHGKDRIQARHGLLEDHGDLVAAQVAHRVVVQSGQVAVLEKDLPFHDPAGRGHQPHDGQGGDALAAPRFPHDPVDLAPANGDGNPADGRDDTLGGEEGGAQVFQGKQRVA